MLENSYYDNKWEVVFNKKEGIKIYCKCECGFKHDISLDKDLDFVGRGTYLENKEEG